jgi:hypothetical protein
MPYIGKWIPALFAIAHVMRADGSDRAAATRQIEAAVRDGALRWVNRGSNQWAWDAEVFAPISSRSGLMREASTLFRTRPRTPSGRRHPGIAWALKLRRRSAGTTSRYQKLPSYDV